MLMYPCVRGPWEKGWEPRSWLAWLPPIWPRSPPVPPLWLPMVPRFLWRPPRVPLPPPPLPALPFIPPPRPGGKTFHRSDKCFISEWTEHRGIQELLGLTHLMWAHWPVQYIQVEVWGASQGWRVWGCSWMSLDRGLFLSCQSGHGFGNTYWTNVLWWRQVQADISLPQWGEPVRSHTMVHTDFSLQ